MEMALKYEEYEAKQELLRRVEEWMASDPRTRSNIELSLDKIDAETGDTKHCPGALLNKVRQIIQVRIPDFIDEAHAHLAAEVDEYLPIVEEELSRRLDEVREKVHRLNLEKGTSLTQG